MTSALASTKRFNDKRVNSLEANSALYPQVFTVNNMQIVQLSVLIVYFRTKAAT